MKVAARSQTTIIAWPMIAILDPPQSTLRQDPLLSPGDCLGPYEILSHLGSGGCGAVFKARHTVLKRTVALKTLFGADRNDISRIARFHREMEASGRLVHPHIVQAYDAGDVNGFYYLAMEFVDGLDVEQLARRTETMPLAEACEIVRQAALGLHHSHEQGILHRDVKPSNILVGRDGVVKVSDLGLAIGDHDFSLTPPDAILGTPDYLSPEHVLRSDKLDARSDLYCLGCTLYRLLAGRAPFDSPRYNSPLNRALAHVKDEPPDVNQMRAGISAPLSGLLKGLLAKEPAQRPANAALVAELLSEPARGANLGALVEHTLGLPAPEVGARFFSADVLQRTTRTYQGRTKSGIASAGPVRPWRRFAALAIGCAIVVVAAGISWPLIGERVLGAIAGNRGPGNPPGTPTNTGSGAGDPRPNAVDDSVPPAAIGRGVNVLPWDFSSPEVPRNAWLELLRHGEPRRVVWPENDFNAEMDVSLPKDELQFRCRETTLVALGEASEHEYIVRAELLQTNWEGRLGIFFGHQRNGEGDDKSQSAQYLTLERTPISLEAAEFSVQRWRVAITDDKERPRIDVRQISRAVIPTPDGTPQQLEFSVRRGKLRSVRWNGIELKDLVTPAVESEFSPSDYTGQIGLVATSSEGILRNARILVPR